MTFRHNIPYIINSFIYSLDIPVMINILYKTRKATGFEALQLKYWEINLAMFKCQTNFWTKLAKRSKVEKVNINIKFCIFKLV